MSQQIKVGDIVRVTVVHAGSLGADLYQVEPLNHSTLNDIESASVMLARAHHRIGELTRERDEWEGEAAAVVRREAEVARLIEDRNNACAARDAAVKSHREAIAAAEQVTRRMEVERDAAVRNCSLTQSRYDALRFENERVTKERDALQVRLDAACRKHVEAAAERVRERDLRQAAERALAEAQRERDAALKVSDDARAAHHIACTHRDAALKERDEARDKFCVVFRCLEEVETREPTTHEKMAKPIGAEGPWKPKPNGYDPGARPVTSDPEPFYALDRNTIKPEKAADPHAWAKPGVWAVWNEAKQQRPPLRLVERCGKPDSNDWWGVCTDDSEDDCSVETRRPATPEETVRFEAELARATCDHMRPTCGQEGCPKCFPPKAAPVFAPSVLGGAIAWAACLTQSVMYGIPAPYTAERERAWMEEIFDLAHKHALNSRCGDLVDAWDLAAPFQDWLDAGAPETWPVKPDTTPTALAVGQRWVFVAQPLDDQIEEGPADADDIITNLHPSARGETVVVSITARPSSRHTDWSEGRFRDHHPRLRLPEELEPAPAPEPAHPKQLCSNCKRGLALAVSMLCSRCATEPEEPYMVVATNEPRRAPGSWALVSTRSGWVCGLVERTGDIIDARDGRRYQAIGLRDIGSRVCALHVEGGCADPAPAPPAEPKTSLPGRGAT